MEGFDIKEAKVVTSISSTDYVFVLQNGVLCKILVADLKKSLK